VSHDPGNRNTFLDRRFGPIGKPVADTESSPSTAAELPICTPLYVSGVMRTAPGDRHSDQERKGRPVVPNWAAG
jgi:hypothetical protein